MKEFVKQQISANSILFKMLKFTYNLYYAAYDGIVEAIRKFTKNGIFFRVSELPMCSIYPEKTLEEVVKSFKPRNALDLGCGVGKALDFFYERKIECVGIDGSSLAIKKAKHPEFMKKFNLNKELNLDRKFDLVWAFEFVEHIHPDYAGNLMKTFSNHSDRVVISAARPGQGGEGHFNEQNDIYWIQKFKEHGYVLNQELTRQFRGLGEKFSGNMYVFER